MRLRIASIAFLLGSLATGVCWFTVQPTLVRLIDLARRTAAVGSTEAELLTRARAALPYSLALDLVVVVTLIYVVLNVTVARPLMRTEETIDQIGRLELNTPLRSSGGPLLSRLQGSLRRMAEALLSEQAVTKRQVRELTATNDQLQKAQTELVASERLATVGKLAAGIAHEVGNPLAGILGYLSVASSRPGATPELKDLLVRIEAEVQRIDQIVRGLLDLGRPSKGELVPVEVAPLAKNCVQLLKGGPDFIGVEVTTELAADAVARAEPGPLSQVLINLLINAAQAMEGKGRIELTAAREGDDVRIVIKDSGPGIAPEVMARLFEPFFTQRKSGKGTGLGLAVSLHLVTSMGGTLTAANVDGGGARFSIALPAA